MAQEPFWPQTMAQVQVALRYQAPDSEDTKDALDQNWIPSIDPVLRWLFAVSHSGGRPKTAASWLRNFGEEFLLKDVTNPLAKRWKQSQLLEQGADDGLWFYQLAYEDKVTFLRCLTEWILTNSDAIRNVIAEEYNIGPKRQYRRNNDLTVQVLGKDQSKHVYYRIDDSARIFKASSSSKNPTLELACDSEQDIDQLAKLLASPNSPAKGPKKAFAPKWTLDEANERRLRDKLLKVLEELDEGEQRRADLVKQRIAKIKAKERKERAMAEAAAAEAARVVAEQELADRTSRGKRVNYADIEGGFATTGDQSDSNSNTLRRSSRRNRDQDYMEDSDDGSGTRRSKRIRPAVQGSRRSTRLTRQNPTDTDMDPVEQAQQFVEAEEAGMAQDVAMADTNLDVQESAPSPDAATLHVLAYQEKRVSSPTGSAAGRSTITSPGSGSE